MRITRAASATQLGADVPADEAQRHPEQQPADHRARGAVEPAEHRGDEAVDHDGVHVRRVHQAAAGDEQPGERADERGERPAQREHPADLHPEQPGDLGVEGRGPHHQPQVGEAEQRDEQPHHDQHRHDREDPEAGDREVQVADLEAAQAERRREGPVARPEDHRRQRVDDDEEAEREDHRVDLGLALDRSDHDPLDHRAEHEAGDQRDREPDPVGVAGVDDDERDVGRDHRHRRLGEVDDPRRAPDQHERQREGGVDHAEGQPGQRGGEELLHEVSRGRGAVRIRGRRGGASRRRRAWPRRRGR